MEHKLTKSAEMKDRTGYFSTHLYRERIYQQKTMAAATHIEFTATQYALLSSLMGVPRVLAAAPTGFLAKHMGWENFFIFCVF